jgi:hypothetical protein
MVMFMFTIIFTSMSMSNWTRTSEYRIFSNVGKPDLPVESQSGTGMKKLTTPEPVRVPERGSAVQHILVRHRTKTTDVGIPMPTLVFSIPMPN